MSSLGERRADPLLAAVEVALAVAQLGEAMAPRVPAPGPLRPFLRFRRMTPAVAGAVRRVVEEDPAFRARVALVADEAEVGRAGELWLRRPEGWEDELADLLGAPMGGGEHLRAARAAEAAARRERDGRVRAEEVTAALRSERDDLVAVVGEEREARRTAEDDAEVARRQLRDAVAARDDAVAQLKAAEARAVDAATERNELRRRVRELEARAGDRDGAGRAAGDRDRAATTGRRGRPRQRSSVRPVLPSGVRGDAPEAVQHLLRLPGATVLVDGYNVSHAAWAGRDLGEQRDRLLDALGEASARTGAHFDAVFDGAEVGHAVARRSRHGVRVRFSPPEVEADDVILDDVAELAAGQPVVVVTSDRRVRDGAARHGVHVVGAGQFLDALGIPRR